TTAPSSPQVQPQTQPQPQSQPLPQNRPVPAPRPAPRPTQSQPIAPFPVNDDYLLIALYGLEANRTSPPTYRPAPQPTYSQPLSAPTLSRGNNNDNDNNANANGNSNVNFNVDLPLLRSFMEANNIRVHQHTPLYNLER
ncbi:anther-specific proline-rich protein APG-like, partial [Tetranychus urticae]|uniref:anther-specific proline-rich protein APG-like n=1 Tax=Tetranychus urticae TaxID=32264 RepID=UPI00077B93C2